jgi:hypothetical protein
MLYRYIDTVVFPEEGQMRFAGQGSRSNKFAIFWTADNRKKIFLDLEGYLRKLALRVTWLSFGSTTVYCGYVRHGVLIDVVLSVDCDQRA